MTKAAFGVVVPAFGHPKFLAEAIISACEQNTDRPVYVVVVDDGCRFVETGETVSHLLPQYKGRLFYLRHSNTRLPGARNAGIRFLLNLQLDIDAIYLLDADNRLAPNSLDVFRVALGDDPSIGWAYPDISFIGVTRGEDGFDTRETAPKYSQLKHLVSNISEAGSLVRADVFRAGVMFDETMTSGFEDWEFWLSALEAGYRGVRVEDTGFMYRGRPESMLADSKRLVASLVETIRGKHKGLFDPKNIMSLEHDEAPACAIFIPEDNNVLLLSDPLLAPRVVTLTQFKTLFHAWAYNKVEHFFPKHILVMPKQVWGHLAAQKQYLRWWFWRVRETPETFFSVKLVDNGNVNFYSIPGETFESGGDLWVLSSELFWQAANGDNTQFDTGAMRSVFLSLPEAGPSADVRVKWKASDLKMILQQMQEELLPLPRHIKHASKAYAGPEARVVLETLYSDIVADQGREPFPSCHKEKTVLIALKADLLSNEAAISVLHTILEQLKQTDSDITVILESTDTIESIQLIGAQYDWQKLVQSIVPLSLPANNLDHLFYLGKRYQRELAAQTADDLAIIAKTADILISCGPTALIEALGEARRHGANGYVYLAPEFFASGTDIDVGLTKLLAFEHAITNVVTDDYQFENLLGAQGFPPSKFTGTEVFLTALSGEDKSLNCIGR